MMQLWMAVDSVRLQSPSIRQGRLGKLRPNCSLSCPAHFDGSVQWWSSNSTPEQASNRRGTCALPRTPQYPSFTLCSFGEMGAVGGRKEPLTASGRWQYSLIQGRASKLWRMRHQKGQLAFSLGYSVSKQQRFSARQKSARVRYPRANEFSPTKFLRASNLGLNFSNRSIFKFSQSLFQKSALISFMESVITPTMLLTCPRSWAFFPRRSALPDRRMMYLAMAADSVSLKPSSMRYGRLGNSKPSFSLSSCHFSRDSYCTYSKSSPLQASNRRRFCPSPRTFQQPNTNLLIRYVSIIIHTLKLLLIVYILWSFLPR